jgi:hypothetical protein
MVTDKMPHTFAELRLQHRLQLRVVEKELRKLDKELGRTKEKPLAETLIEIIESTRGILIKGKECGRCNLFLLEREFDKYAFYCHTCRAESKRKRTERRRIYGKNYRNSSEYKQRRNQQLRDRLKHDDLFRLTKRIRGRISNFIKLRGVVRLQSTKEMLGCSFDFLKQHIESQFTEGMSWENIGRWHIDHKSPLATAITSEDIVRLNHYTNLRPLWAIDNLIKGTKYAKA